MFFLHPSFRSSVPPVYSWFSWLFPLSTFLIPPVVRAWCCMLPFPLMIIPLSITSTIPIIPTIPVITIMIVVMVVIARMVVISSIRSRFLVLYLRLGCGIEKSFVGAVFTYCSLGQIQHRDDLFPIPSAWTPRARKGNIPQLTRFDRLSLFLDPYT